MRNKKRIKPFLKAIEKFWNKYPDMRFTQVVVSFLPIDFSDSSYYYKEDDFYEDRIQNLIDM